MYKKRGKKRKRQYEEGSISEEREEEGKRPTKPKAPRPNYFIAVQVTSPQVCNEAYKVHHTDLKIS